MLEVELGFPVARGATASLPGAFGFGDVLGWRRLTPGGAGGRLGLLGVGSLGAGAEKRSVLRLLVPPLLLALRVLPIPFAVAAGGGAENRSASPGEVCVVLR